MTLLTVLADLRTNNLMGLGAPLTADIDAELKQLSVDPRRSPQRVGDAHLANKLAYLCR